MPMGDNRLNPKDPPLPLIDYELPKTAVEPSVRACRLFNTMLDLIFYNVPGLAASLSAKDAPMKAQGEKPPSRIVDFDPLADPEGSLLLIDVTTAPYVHRFKDVELFLGSLTRKRVKSESRPLRALAARRWAARPSPGTFRRRSGSRF